MKSALENFAEKYVIDGKPKIIPFDYFAEKATQIKEFLRNHRNIKIRMIMLCIMERQSMENRKTFITQDKAYFNTETYINLESTDVKVILSGWYFKEVFSLEIHIINYKPIKGSSYIPLPDFLMRKKAIINIRALKRMGGETSACLLCDA